MGKGGNASAAGPKPVGKGLNPDRQYTQIRGQVRVAPRARRSSLRRTRRPVSRTTQPLRQSARFKAWWRWRRRRPRALARSL